MLQGNHYYILVSSECLEWLFKSKRCNNSSGREAQVLSHFKSSTWSACHLKTMVSSRTVPSAPCWTTDTCLLCSGDRCHALNHKTKHTLGRSPTHTASLSQYHLAHEKLFGQKVLEDLAKNLFCITCLALPNSVVLIQKQISHCFQSCWKISFFFKQG